MLIERTWKKGQQDHISSKIKLSSSLTQTQRKKEINFIVWQIV